MDLSLEALMAWVEANTALAIVLALTWILPWKAWALWLAARRGEKGWFILLLILNTLAIAEIFYIFFVAKQKDRVG